MVGCLHSQSRRRTPMSADVIGKGAWALELLRCPFCMSKLAIGTRRLDGVMRDSDGAPQDQGGVIEQGREQGSWVLRCGGCERVYPFHHVPLSRAGGDAGRSVLIPRLRRGDDLATLEQDIVVNRVDPDSTRLDRRQHVAQAERRERFLQAIMGRIPEPYAILAARDRSNGRDEQTVSPHEAAALDRFLNALPGASRGGGNGGTTTGADGGGWTTVLDLACGEGDGTARLVERGYSRGLRAIGLDGSLPSLRRAVTSATAANHNQDTLFVDGDMMEMPLASAAFDGVWCHEAFEYVRPDRRTVFFRQVNRVLRPGGVLFLSAETAGLRAIARQYLLWRLLYRKPVIFWEYLYPLPRAHGGGWHYHAMTAAHTLRDLCRAHGFTVLSLQQAGSLWLLLARKQEGTR